MNFDAISALAELIAAIGVIVTLIYLAVQIKKQTEEARLAATRELAKEYRDILEPLTFHPEVLDLYRRAIADYDSLPEDERIRIHFLISRFFRWNEQQHLQMSRGNYDDSFFESMTLRLIEFLSNRGIQQWWRRNKDAFGREFRDFVEANLIEAAKRGYDSSPNIKSDSK